MKVRGVIDPRREDGVAMTEFALILPIFMLIVAGMLGFGRVFFYWIQANHVANETARWAIVDRNPYAPQTLQQHAANSATVEFNTGTDQTTVCITRTGTDLGDPLKVTVAKPFGFVPILGIGKITIRASSTMRVERLGGTDASNNAIPSSYTEGCQT
jgi:Flp pilus assembly protein TadG